VLVFDLQALQSAAHGQRGIGRYVYELAATLDAEHPDAVDAFAWNDRLQNDRLQPVPALDRLGFGERLVPFSALAGERVDVLHVNSPFEMLDLDQVAVPVEARRLVVTCYDLIPYRFANLYLANPRVAARYRARLAMLASADAIVADSQSAAADLVELAGLDPRRVNVIGAGVGDQFVPPADDHETRMSALRADVPGIRRDFVLVPTGMDWRKNAAGAIVAYAALPDRLRERHQLVLTCDVEPGYEAWLQLVAREHGVNDDRLVLTGHVADTTLVTLYQTAELVMFPSYYEGFGLPVLEAIRCGARVIAGGVSSLPELVGDHRALFDPWDTDDMARVLEGALVDRGLGARAGTPDENRFTWPATVRRLVDVYARVQASIRGADLRSA
jgi:glycosyltransferase involved in cell wall biosynthesis